MTYKQSQDILRKETQQNTHNLYHKNLEDIISERIYTFFPDGVLANFPTYWVKYILSSELIYYHMLHTSSIDWVWVLVWYQKILDAMIEIYITEKLRDYIQRSELSLWKPENIPLEKSLYRVIHKKYSLSPGRLYQVLSHISQKNLDYTYEKVFFDFLESERNLKNILLDSQFLLQLESLIEQDVTGEKRHIWFLWLPETTSIRDLYIGNFQNTNSLLYILASSQSL